MVNNSWLSRLIWKKGLLLCKKSLFLLNYMTESRTLLVLFFRVLPSSLFYTPHPHAVHSISTVCIFHGRVEEERPGLEKQRRRKAVGGPSFTEARDVSSRRDSSYHKWLPVAGQGFVIKWRIINSQVFGEIAYPQLQCDHNQGEEAHLYSPAVAQQTPPRAEKRRETEKEKWVI